MSHKPTFDNWDVRYYTEQTNENDETRIHALFERYEDRLTFVVYPTPDGDVGDDTSLKTNVKHEYVLIHPYYDSYSPKMWTDISEVEEWGESVFYSPHIGWSRSSLGQFDWDQVPDEMARVSTYKDNFPLPYDYLVNNIESHTTLVRLFKNDTGLIEDPYPIDVYMKRLENDEVVPTFSVVIPDVVRETTEQIVTPQTVADSVLDQLEVGEKEFVGTVYVTYDDSQAFSLGVEGASLVNEKFNAEEVNAALKRSSFYPSDDSSRNE